jgi:hypothetical protein
MKKLADSVRALEEISDTLIGDVTKCQKMLNKATKPFWRRTLVRSLFACMEGITHCMKSVAIELAEVNAVEVTRAEYALLREEAYNLTDKGDAMTSKCKVKTVDNLVFSLRTTARAGKSSYAVDKTSENWCCLKEALRIRDRITHPKVSGDLEISDFELRAIQKTIKWYFESVYDVISIVVRSFDDLLKDEQFRKSLKRDAAKRRPTA